MTAQPEATPCSSGVSGLPSFQQMAPLVFTVYGLSPSACLIPLVVINTCFKLLVNKTEHRYECVIKRRENWPSWLFVFLCGLHKIWHIIQRQWMICLMWWDFEDFYSCSYLRKSLEPFKKYNLYFIVISFFFFFLKWSSAVVLKAFSKLFAFSLDIEVCLLVHLTPTYELFKYKKDT